MRLDVQPPVFRLRGILLMSLAFSRSFKARNIVLLDSPKSLDIVTVDGQHSPFLFALSHRYAYTVTALCGKSRSYILRDSINFLPPLSVCPYVCFSLFVIVWLHLNDLLIFLVRMLYDHRSGFGDFNDLRVFCNYRSSELYSA